MRGILGLAIAALLAAAPSAAEPARPFASSPMAVSDGGGVAWPAGERLLAFGVSGSLRELDRGAPGAIAGLHAEGRAVVWTNGGAARSADLG